VIQGHAGSTGLGLGAYLRDRVDAIRGADDDRHRVEKMRKMDVKIKEVGHFVLFVLHWLILNPLTASRCCRDSSRNI
jgi:hypothetical protein